MKYFVILVLLFAGCGQSNTEVEPEEVKENMTYFRDDRTGLCFASVNSRTYNAYSVTSISCVPCDSVKHLLK